jgi:hypothetical protein
MAYIRFTNCRVCALQDRDHKAWSDLDFKILEGVPLKQVLGEYAGFFTEPGKPLTFIALSQHKKHLKSQVANNLLGLPDASTSNSASEIVINDGTNGLISYVDELNRNKETLDMMLASAEEDLIKSDEFLAGATTPKNQALLLSVRDNIRQSITEISQKSLEAISPNLANVNTKDNPQVIELLMIVKKAMNLTIRDKDLREEFKKELSTQISFSKELKWLNEDHK